MWHNYLAQQGYIVMSVDNRGTNVPRGRAWRKSIYLQVGILAAHDQAKAAKEIFKLFPFVDSDRVGMWGWSGGGQMTMNCLFRYPKTDFEHLLLSSSEHWSEIQTLLHNRRCHHLHER